METILSVRDLNVAFHTYAGTVQAVRGVSFDLKKVKHSQSLVSPVLVNRLLQKPSCV